MSDLLTTLSIALKNLHQLAREHRLYAVLDTCDAPHVRSAIDQLDSSRALCLYSGEIPPEVLEVAPYLTLVDGALLDWLVNAWTEPWGIFVVTKMDPATLRKHLRKFLLVQDPVGEVMYFRYYDPRVLPPFLLTCNSQELTQFFGNIEAFGGTYGKESGQGFLIYKH